MWVSTQGPPVATRGFLVTSRELLIKCPLAPLWVPGLPWLLGTLCQWKREPTILCSIIWTFMFCKWFNRKWQDCLRVLVAWRWILVTRSYFSSRVPTSDSLDCYQGSLVNSLGYLSGPLSEYFLASSLVRRFQLGAPCVANRVIQWLVLWNFLCGNQGFPRITQGLSC
jgi:hypothetical protein